MPESRRRHDDETDVHPIYSPPVESRPPAASAQQYWAHPLATSPQGGYWAPAARYGNSSLALLAGLSLLILGLLQVLLFGLGLLVFDLVLAFTGEMFVDAPTAGTVRMTVVGLVVVSAVQVAVGIGVLAHRLWARVLGIALSTVGTLAGVLLLAAATTDTPSTADLAAAVLVVAGYGLALFGLVAGGFHFRRGY